MAGGAISRGLNFVFMVGGDRKSFQLRSEVCVSDRIGVIVKLVIEDLAWW